jgi:hypothetical protein
MEASRLKTYPWRANRPVVAAADSYHFDEEQDPDPDLHISEKLDPDPENSSGSRGLHA